MILLKTLIKLPFTSPLLPQGSRECLALRKNKCRHYRLFSSSSCRICSLFTQYPDTRLSKNNAEELLGAVLVPPSSKVPFHNERRAQEPAAAAARCVPTAEGGRAFRREPGSPLRHRARPSGPCCSPSPSCGLGDLRGVSGSLSGLAVRVHTSFPQRFPSPHGSLRWQEPCSTAGCLRCFV